MGYIRYNEDYILIISHIFVIIVYLNTINILREYVKPHKSKYLRTHYTKHVKIKNYYRKFK